MAREFYKEPYTSEGVHDMHEVLDTVPVKVSSNMNLMLDKPFDMAEVKAALFEMYPTKGPGPNGFPAHFFKGTGSCVVRRLQKLFYEFWQGRTVRR